MTGLHLLPVLIALVVILAAFVWHDSGAGGSRG